MKSLSESLLRGKVSVDVGPAIKDALGMDKESAIDFEVKDNTLLVRVDPNATNRVLNLNKSKIKYLTSLKINRITSEDNIVVIIPLQDTIKDISLNYESSEVRIIGDGRGPVLLNGWKLTGGNLTVDVGGRPLVIKNTTFSCMNEVDSIFAVRLLDITDLEWKHNTIHNKHSICITTPRTETAIMNKLKLAGFMPANNVFKGSQFMDLDMYYLLGDAGTWSYIRYMRDDLMLDFKQVRGGWKVEGKIF